MPLSAWPRSTPTWPSGWPSDGRKVILIRPETKPDDVHGMLASEGILTTRGGRTSHAALVARQFGKPAVVGVSALEVDLVGHRATVGDLVIEEGDWVSLDGSTGEVFPWAARHVRTGHHRHLARHAALLGG